MSFSAIIAAAGAITSAAVNYFTSKNAADKSSERQKDLIKDEREYNLPANQVARYEAAGINPKAVFGNISSTGSGATSAPQAEGSKVGNAFADAIAAKSAVESIKNLKSQRENLDAETRQKDVQTEYIKSQIPLVGDKRTLISRQVAAAEANLPLIKERLRLTTAQADDLENALKYYKNHGVFRESDYKKTAVQMILNTSKDSIEGVGSWFYDLIHPGKSAAADRSLNHDPFSY